MAMGTSALLEHTGFHKLASLFNFPKVRQRLQVASWRAESYWRGRVPQPNPLDTKKYLNRYSFNGKQPITLRQGRPQLTELEFVLKCVDLSFVRHIAAPTYKMLNWQAIHDPVYLYAIHLWISAENLYHEAAIDLLNDERRGRDARKLIGLRLDEVPKTYTVLTRFLERLGDDGMWNISTTYLRILADAGFFTGPLYAAIDSQLVASFSRYRGCNAFQLPCRRLELSRQQLRAALQEALDIAAAQWPKLRAQGLQAQRHPVWIDCPFGTLKPGTTNPLRFRLAWLRLFEKRVHQHLRDQAPLYGAETAFIAEHDLGFCLEETILDPTLAAPWAFPCPRLPSDLTARIGFKNSNQPDGHPIPVFGADLEQITFLLPEYGLELPFGVLGAPGNSPTRLPRLLEILDRPDRPDCTLRPLSVSMDARYDSLAVYEALRARQIVPVVDLVHHKNEDSPEATAKRAITMEGVPLACCGVQMNSSGFDPNEKRRTFFCDKQCGSDTCSNCPYGSEVYPRGQRRRVSITQYPRYVNEVARDSAAYRALEDKRTAAERTHADVLQAVPRAVGKQRLRGVRKIAAKAAIAHHFLLWKRIVTFVSDVNHANEVAGLHQLAVDDAIVARGLTTFHAMKDSDIEGLKPSHHT